MFTYLFFKQIQKYILLKKCSNDSLSHVRKNHILLLTKSGDAKCTAIMTGKRFNLGNGEGLQVPCTLKITGERKFLSILTEQFNVLKEKQ